MEDSHGLISEEPQLVCCTVSVYYFPSCGSKLHSLECIISFHFHSMVDLTSVCLLSSLKKEHYIMIKGSIQEEDITIINIYAPNIAAPQYVRQTLMSMKEEINSNTIIVGDFNTPLTTMDRSTKQKINKETQTLNDSDGPARPN